MTLRKKLLIFVMVGVMLFSFKLARANGPLNGEVVIFDVTDIAFSVLWVVSEPSQCDIQLFDGSNTLLTEGVDYMLYNDSHELGGGGGYSIAETNGVMVVTVYNLPKNTDSTTQYYIRTITMPQSGGQIIYPDPGSDPIGVTTMQSPSGVQLPLADNEERYIYILDDNGDIADGSIAILEIEGASYPVGYYKPAEEKWNWASDLGSGLNLGWVYNASDNKSFLELYRGEDAGIDATLKIYGGIKGYKEVFIEDFWAKTDEMLNLLVDPGDPFSSEFTLEGALEPPVEPMTVDAGINQTINEGDEASFNGTITDTIGTGPYTIEWDFDDGASATGTLTPAHVYADNGTYTVSLTVTSDGGIPASDTLTVIVDNVAPIVTASAPPTVNQDEDVSFSGAFSDQGIADTHTIEWNFGDGATASDTLTPTHVYTEADAYTVTLTVTDDDGGVGTDTMTVNVSEVIELTQMGPFVFEQGLNLFAIPPFDSFYNANEELIVMDAQTMLATVGASKIYRFDASLQEWVEPADDYVLELGTGYFILLESEDPVEVSFNGTLVTDPILPINLTAGLNLISVYDPDYTYTSYDVLTAVDGLKIYQWEDSLWQFPYTLSSDPSEIFDIESATAYFVYIE
ncbi:MAG: PKD domain-containing protein [bacterium]